MENDLEILQPRNSKNKSRNQNQTVQRILISLFTAIVIAGVSFYGGIAYQEGHSSSAQTNRLSSGANSSEFIGRFGGFRSNRTIGMVTSISSSSITVKPNFGNTQSKTFNITSSTIITDQGQSSTIGSIATGDTVIIIVSSSNSNDASMIDINPSFGSFNNGAGNTPGPSSTQSAQTNFN